MKAHGWTSCRPLRRVIAWAAALLLGLPLALTLLYAVVAPPITPLMAVRWFQGHGIEKSWKGRDQISVHLQRALIAAEDQRFCGHRGFDWREMERAYKDLRSGRRLRGASTISMQTAKNLYLWPGRTYLRKGLEFYLTPYIELIMSKSRILELYMNIVEFGPGIYGAEAAAQIYFKRPASALTKRQAALLAAVLPSPLQRRPDRPTDYLNERAAAIRKAMAQVDVFEGRVCAKQLRASKTLNWLSTSYPRPPAVWPVGA